MVRGNWQKRVETAQARRKETRQRKLQRENRGHYKTLVQTQLWGFLDQIMNHPDFALVSKQDHHTQTQQQHEEEEEVDNVDGRNWHGRSQTNNTNRKSNDTFYVHIWTDVSPQSHGMKINVSEYEDLNVMRLKKHPTTFASRKKSDSDLLSNQEYERTSELHSPPNPSPPTLQTPLDASPKELKNRNSRRHSFDDSLETFQRMDTSHGWKSSTNTKKTQIQSQGRKHSASFSISSPSSHHALFTSSSSHLCDNSDHGEGLLTTTEEGGWDQQQAKKEAFLCRKYFFTGKCSYTSTGSNSNSSAATNSTSKNHGSFLNTNTISSLAMSGVSTSTIKGSKRSSTSKCIYQHYPLHSHQRTLSDILSITSTVFCRPVSKVNALLPVMNRTSSSNYSNNEMNELSDTPMFQETLKLSLDANAAAFAEFEDSAYESDHHTGDGPMDMLYHILIPIQPETALHRNMQTLVHGEEDEVAPSSRGIASAQILQTLAQEKLPMGSIVYVVLDTLLIFDRYRGGLLMTTPSDFCIQMNNSVGIPTFYPAHQVTRKLSFMSMSSNVHETDAANKNTTDTIQDCSETFCLVEKIPDTVVEYILTFLPNEACGIIPLVCKTWYNEIGTTSPSLWKAMLKRNKWPDSIHNEMDERKNRESRPSDYKIYKDLFVSHFSMIKNVCSICNGAKRIAIAATSSSRLTTTKDSLILQLFEPACCIGLFLFSEVQVLAAYHNCTVRLYQIAETNQSALQCKQSVSVRVAPFAVSKKTSCHLRTIGLDDEMILCSFVTHNIKRANDPSRNCWLTAIRREELLCVSTNTKQEELDKAIEVFNMWKGFIDYLQRIIDHAPDELAEFLILEGDLLSLHLNLKGNISPCGNGRFLFLADIQFYDDDLQTLTNVASVAIVFSVPGTSIVWMNFLPSYLQPQNSTLFLSAFRGRHCRTVTNAVVTSSQFSPVLLMQIEWNNMVQFKEITDETIRQRNLMIDDTWRVETDSMRPALVLQHEIVIADQLPTCAWSLTFLSFTQNVESSLCTLVLSCCSTLLEMFHVGDYIIAHCELYCELSNAQDNIQNGYIAIHIPTRAEIFRIPTGIVTSRIFGAIPLVSVEATVFSDKLFSIILSSKSSQDSEEKQNWVVMTNQITRALMRKESSTPKNSYEDDVAKKKKKKSPAKKPGKKDGFARGMTLRG